MAIVGLFPHGRKQIPASIDFRATTGDNTLHLRPQTGGFDCTIHWGDGTTTKAPANGGNVIHSYATAKVYNIQIKGKSFAGFYVNNQAGKEKYIAAYSMGQWAVDTMTSLAACFYGCSNLKTITAYLLYYNAAVTSFISCFQETALTSIPADLFRYNTAATNFGGCFQTCSALTSIPADLFRYNTAATDFSYCFPLCTALTSIPADLFRYNTAATDFSYCFAHCTALTLRLDIFGTDYANRFNRKTVRFMNCFYRSSFTGIKGTAPELWRFSGLTAAKDSCFGGAGNSATSLSNYASIPAEWK